MACLHESHRHIGTHSTKTDHAKLHLSSPMSETVHTASLFHQQSPASVAPRRSPQREYFTQSSFSLTGNHHADIASANEADRLSLEFWPEPGDIIRRQQNIKTHKIKHRRRDDLNFPTPYIVQESDGALSITASDQA